MEQAAPEHCCCRDLLGQGEYYNDVVPDASPPDKLLGAISGYLPDHPPFGAALDLGCGTGHTLQWLAERGFHVEGVDISRNRVALARARLASRGLQSARVVMGDVITYLRQKPGSACQLAVSLYLISHLGQSAALRMVGEAMRVVGPAGRVVVADHVAGGLVETRCEKHPDFVVRTEGLRTFRVLKRPGAVASLMEASSANALVAHTHINSTEIIVLRGVPSRI